jgi:hypothetical protein
MKINHHRVFLHALRSALLIVAGFIAYEILIEVQKYYNLGYNQRKIYKLMFIFMVDLAIIYGVYFLFDVEL